MKGAPLRFHAAPELLSGAGERLAMPREHVVEVWGWELDEDGGLAESALPALAPDERVRMARFTQPRDRTRFAVAHAVMRTLLARYVGGTPSAIPIAQARGCRPALSTGTLEFNLTHSAGRALLAVATAPVGIDLECEGLTLDPLAVAERYFHGEERAAIRGADAGARNGVFLRHWVAKEAVVKGQGDGLDLPLTAFTVRPDRDGGTARVTSHDLARLHGDWRVEYLRLDAGWHAAVAMRGSDWSVQPRDAGVSHLPA